MSKWTETRDSIVEELRKAAMLEEAKQRVTAAVIAEGLPVMEVAVKGYASKLEEDAKRDERAWVRWGEGIVLPGLLRVAMWLVKLTLNGRTGRRAGECGSGITIQYCSPEASASGLFFCLPFYVFVSRLWVFTLKYDIVWIAINYDFFVLYLGVCCKNPVESRLERNIHHDGK